MNDDNSPKPNRPNIQLQDAYRFYYPTPTNLDFTWYRSKEHFDIGRGHRLDYVLTSPELLKPLRHGIDPFISEIRNDESVKGSDHTCLFFTLKNAAGDTPTPHEERQDLKDSKGCETSASHPNASVSQLYMAPIGKSLPPAEPRGPLLHPAMNIEDLCSELDSICSISARPPGPLEGQYDHNHIQQDDCKARRAYSQGYEYDESKHPPCISTPHEFKFDTKYDCESNPYPDLKDPHSDSRQPRRPNTAGQVSSGKGFKVSEETFEKLSDKPMLSELRSCSAITATVPLANITVGKEHSVTMRVLLDTGASYTTISKAAL